MPRRTATALPFWAVLDRRPGRARAGGGGRGDPAEVAIGERPPALRGIALSPEDVEPLAAFLRSLNEDYQ